MRKVFANRWTGMALVLVISAVLRIYGLGAESLWLDEGYSLRDASDPGRLSIIRPFYFVLLHFWMKLGHSEAWLRLPAVIFGIGSVAMAYVVANRLYGHRVAVLPSLLMAVSPLHINHSQEVRMYSLTTLLVLASVCFFIRFADTGRARDMIAALVSSGLAFTVFPLTITMLLVFGLYMIGHWKTHRPASLRWLSVQGVLALTALPLVPRLIAATGDYAEAWTWRMGSPGAMALVRATRDFNLWRVPAETGPMVLLADIYGILVLALAAYGGICAWHAARQKTSLVALWLAVPLLTGMAISHLHANIWMVRYMIYASPAYYLLIALGLVALRSRGLFGIGLVAVMALPLARLGIYYARPNRPEWRQGVAYIERHVRRDDVIALYRYGNKYVFDYYYAGPAAWVALGPSEISRSTFEGWNESRVARMMSAIPSGHKRIWFVLSYHEDAGGFTVENYIRRHYRILEECDFERVKIYLAAPKGVAL